MDTYRLFPPTSITHSGHLHCGQYHRVYWEECGTPTGIPVVFLHGGPGAGCQPWQRQFFNPEKYRIILLDQRGCGKSLPFADILDNTTQDLVNDLERLRQHLSISKWLVFGGSWGSTLALVYAQTHPQNCLGLILRGIFLGTQAEIDWFMQGMQNFFPEAAYRFQHISDHLPEERIQAAGEETLFKTYYRRLMDPDPNIHRRAAFEWFMYETCCATLIPSDPPSFSAYTPEMLSLARLEAHYFFHKCFLEEDEIIQKSAKLQNLPLLIIQGRYDVICPPVSAWRLHQHVASSHLTFVNDAGHSAGEKSIQQALVQASEVFWQQILT